MKIDFERSGGFAGMRMTTSLDTVSLDLDKANKLEDAVRNSSFFTLAPKTIKPKMGADFFRYKITIETQDKKHTVEVTDMTIPPKLKPLIDMLVESARD